MAKKRRVPPAPLPPPKRRSRRGRDWWLQIGAVAGFAVFLGVLLGVIGYGWWDSQMGPPRSKAMQVGDTSLNLDLFTRRLKGFLQDSGLVATGKTVDPSTLTQLVPYIVGALQQELLLRERAPADLGLTVRPEDVKAAIATRLNVSADDAALFDAAYKQDLKAKDLSDEEYRQMIEASVLTTWVQEGFVRAAPEAADQVRIRQIQVGAKEDADKVEQRLSAGEDFGTVAKDMSSDTATKDNGGEKGWVVQQELDPAYAAKVFALDVGQRSDPLAGPGGFLIVEMEEKQAGRPLETQQRTNVGSAYFSDWLAEQSTLVKTTNYVGADADKLQWVVNHAT